MANLLQIKNLAASYLDRPTADLTHNGQDLFLLAANQVRKTAELQYDLEFSRKLVTVPVNGTTGGDLAGAEDANGESIDVKTVIEAGLLDEQGNLIPVIWTTAAESMERQRGDNMRVTPRYPTDAYYRDIPYGQSRFTFSGSSIRRWPKTDDSTPTTFDLWLEVYSFQTDWTDADLEDTYPSVPTSDIWTTHGQQYLQWAVIVQLNQLFKHFVFRQEGNLPPPEKLAEAGLATLVDWDANKFEQFRRHER